MPTGGFHCIILVVPHGSERESLARSPCSCKREKWLLFSQLEAKKDVRYDAGPPPYPIFFLPPIKYRTF